MKGILVNWDLERQVWNQIFKKQSVDFSSTSLIVTEPIFNFNHTQECIEEICFEEYGFEGLIRINGKLTKISSSVINSIETYRSYTRRL